MLGRGYKSRLWSLAAFVGAVVFLAVYQLFSKEAMPLLLAAYAVAVGKLAEHGAHPD
jgi:hypothetical protein